MHRCIHLTLLLAAALALLAVPIASGASPDLVVSQVYAGGGNSGATYANDFVELFNRSSSTVDLSGWSVQYATASGTTWQVTTLAGSLAPGHHYLVALASGGANGASAARRRCDRHVEPRGVRRQGRARARRDRARLRSDGRELQRGCGRPRPRRLRIGDRLRGRRRARALEHAAAFRASERLRRHRRERHRLHDRHSCAANHVVGDDDVQRHDPASVRLDLGRGERRPRSAVDALDRPREADAQLRQRLTRELSRRRSPSGSPSRARTAPATHSALTGAPSHPPTFRSASPRRRRHGRHARAVAGRRRPGGAADRTCSRPDRRHDVGAERLRPETPGRRASPSPPRSRHSHRATTRRPSPSR